MPQAWISRSFIRSFISRSFFFWLKRFTCIVLFIHANSSHDHFCFSIIFSLLSSHFWNSLHLGLDSGTTLFSLSILFLSWFLNWVLRSRKSDFFPIYELMKFAFNFYRLSSILAIVFYHQLSLQLAHEVSTRSKIAKGNFDSYLIRY